MGCGRMSHAHITTIHTVRIPLYSELSKPTDAHKTQTPPPDYPRPAPCTAIQGMADAMTVLRVNTIPGVCHT